MKKLLLILPILILIGCTGRITHPVDKPMNINSFEECMNAGNPVMESYPRQCQANGQVFTEEVINEELPINCQKPSEIEISCNNNSGIWIAGTKECENVDQKWCDENGGTWNECASSCRNNPEAEICTMQCVIVCQF